MLCPLGKLHYTELFVDTLSSMSVWFVESFRGQVFWDLARLKHLRTDEWDAMLSACPVQFAGGKIEATGPYEEVVFPSGMSSEIDRTWIRDTFYHYTRETSKLIDGGYVTTELLKANATFTTGFNAVLRLYMHCKTDLLPLVTRQARREADFLKTFSTHAFRAQYQLMKTTPEIAAAAAARVDFKAFAECSTYQNLADVIRRLLTTRFKNQARLQATGKKKVRNHLQNFAEDVGLPDDWVVHYDGWITYVQLPDDEETEWLALTTVDIDRLQQMLISRSMVSAHEAVWAATAGNDVGEYRAHRRVVERIFDGAIRKAAADPHEAGSLCKDLRKAFNAYLSMAAGELSDAATDDMLAEIKKGRGGKFFNVQNFINALCAMPFDVAQDVGRIYKLLAAPDYDIGESFAARQKQHLKMNPLMELFGDNECSLREFRLYFKKLLALTLTRKNGGKGVGSWTKAVKPRWWDDYIKQGILPGPLESYEGLSLKGTAVYTPRSDESPDILKDSAACEERLEDAEDYGEDCKYRRNMLLRYLYDPTCPVPTQAAVKLTRKEHVHRVGFKMEAHKPVSRLFFIGNMTDRMVQSEMEENVHRVALNCPGYMIGQTPELTTRKIMSMVAPSLQHDERVYYFNFDISAWSPGMRDDIQRISHESWGEVFDCAHFYNAHRINEKSTILLNKRGYSAKYVNPGANLEGYNGKEMTFMHCALMGYSVHRYRRATGHEVSIPLAAYIDDGLAAFKEHARHGTARFLQFCDFVEDTYQRLGFQLEKSKCFMSDSFAIFLNEIYFEGRHVTYGLRAVMRVGTREFERHETLHARASTYASGAQGAMKAGLELVSAFFLYLWLIGRMLLVYGASAHLDARASVLYAFTPKGLGGLGAGSVIGICTNLVVDNLVEGITCIQAMARAYPSYEPKVVAILRQPVVEKDFTGLLLAPTSLDAPRVKMSENRLSAAVAHGLAKAKLAPRAKRLFTMAKDVKLTLLADAFVGPNTQLAPAVLDLAMAGTPMALIDALVRKFQSSRTMVMVIGSGEMRRITRENRHDGMSSLAQFKRI